MGSIPCIHKQAANVRDFSAKSNMKSVSSSTLTVLLLMTLMAGSIPVIGQQVQKPFETRLLNGLKLVVFKTSEEIVTVRLRIHAGSSFDMAGKEGTFKLLTEILFPTEELRAFIQEDFGTELRLITNYDFIEIQTGAKKERMISLLETLAARLSNPEITAETTDAAKKLLRSSNSPSLQDRLNQETASYHLGAYPQGRPVNGTDESIARIDFADIVQARSRFLSPDNATLVISGDVDEGLMSRAARRLLGPWTRADQKPRWAFAAPQKAELTGNVVAREGIAAGVHEFRLAVRNFSRTDAKYSSYQILLPILKARLESRFDTSTLEDRGHRVQGALILGGTSRMSSAGDFLSNNLFQDVTEFEFSEAKRTVAVRNRTLIERYLDADTYGFSSLEQESSSLTKVTLEDLNNTIRFLKDSPRTLIVFKSAGTDEGSTK